MYKRLMTPTRRFFCSTFFFLLCLSRLLDCAYSIRKSCRLNERKKDLSRFYGTVQKLCHGEGGLIYARILLATRLSDAGEAFNILSSRLLSARNNLENFSALRDEKIHRSEGKKTSICNLGLLMTPCTDCDFVVLLFLMPKRRKKNLVSFAKI